MQQAWADASRSDKEFGGDKLNESLAVAKQALDTYGDAELKSLLHSSGLGNHPALIRLLVKTGKTLATDAVVTGRAPAGGKSLADRLYS